MTVFSTQGTFQNGDIRRLSVPAQSAILHMNRWRPLVTEKRDANLVGASGGISTHRYPPFRVLQG